MKKPETILEAQKVREEYASWYFETYQFPLLDQTGRGDVWPWYSDDDILKLKELGFYERNGKTFRLKISDEWEASVVPYGPDCFSAYHQNRLWIAFFKNGYVEDEGEYLNYSFQVKGAIERFIKDRMLSSPQTDQ